MSAAGFSVCPCSHGEVCFQKLSIPLEPSCNCLLFLSNQVEKEPSRTKRSRKLAVEEERGGSVFLVSWTPFLFFFLSIISPFTKNSVNFRPSGSKCSCCSPPTGLQPTQMPVCLLAWRPSPLQISWYPARTWRYANLWLTFFVRLLKEAPDLCIGLTFFSINLSSFACSLFLNCKAKVGPLLPGIHPQAKCVLTPANLWVVLCHAVQPWISWFFPFFLSLQQKRRCTAASKKLSSRFSVAERATRSSCSRRCSLKNDSMRDPKGFCWRPYCCLLHGCMSIFACLPWSRRQRGGKPSELPYYYL